MTKWLAIPIFSAILLFCVSPAGAAILNAWELTGYEGDEASAGDLGGSRDANMEASTLTRGAGLTA